MVLKLQLDFSWISFCPKIVADQEIGIWTSLEHHLETIEFFEKKFQTKIQISKISKNSKKFQDVKITKKWLLKLSFLVLISVKKRQVKSHLRSRPDLNIDLIHFHYHRVPKSSENGRFWPEIWKIQKFRKFHVHLELFSGRKMKWYQEIAIIWPDFLKRLKLGEISKMLA